MKQTYASTCCGWASSYTIWRCLKSMTALARAIWRAGSRATSDYVLRGLWLVCVVTATALVSPVSAQTTARIPSWGDQGSPSRVVGKFLWRGIDGPDALLVPAGGVPPFFDWQRLLIWNCNAHSGAAELRRCAKGFMDQRALPLVGIRQIGSQRDGIPEARQYQIDLDDGQHYDVYLLQGSTALPILLEDDSKIVQGCLEDEYAASYPTPWGAPLGPVSYTHGTGHHCLRYFRRVLSDGRIAWSKVFLMRGQGRLVDRTNAVVEEDPVLEFFDIRAIPGTVLGIIRTWTADDEHLGFGAVSAGIDLTSGELLSNDPRLVAVLPTDLAKLFDMTIASLMQSGRIDERNTVLLKDAAGASTGTRRLGKSQRAFESEIREALVDSYFKRR